MQVLAMLFAAAFLLLPVVAFLVALNALSRVKSRLPGTIGGQLESLEAQVKALERQVRRLTTRLAELEGGAPEPAPTEPAAAPVEALPPTLEPSPPPVPAISQPLPPTRTLEERIGARWTTWAGIVVLVFVVGLCFREVFSRNLIGYAARVAIGIVTGLVMVLGGLAIRRRKALPYLSVGLTGGGLAVLYLSVFAGYNLYHLFPATTAFAAMFAVTVGGSAIAVLAGQLPIAVLAVVGGLLTPILAHGERADERVLIGYLVVLDLMVLAVSRWRSWPALNRLAWVGSAMLLAPVIARAHAAPHPEARLLLLTALFAVFVATPVLRAWLDRFGSEPLDLVLVIANGALYFAAVYVTLEEWHPSFEGPWALALAAGYVAVGMFHRERVPDDDVTVDVHYGAAAVLLALAFPLMLDGPWVTMAWAAQAVVLVLVAARTPQRDVAVTGAIVLFAAAMARAGYLDRFWYPPATRITNVTFAVGLAVVAALGIAGYLASRVARVGGKLRSVFWVGGSLLMAALLWREPTGVWPGVLLTIEVVVLALLARRQGDPAFRAGAVLLAAIALARLYAWDARRAADAAVVLFNVWLLVRVGGAIAVAYAGRTLRGAGDEADRSAGRGLLGLAWIELLTALSLGWFLYMDLRIHEESNASLVWRMQLGLSALWALYSGISLALGLAWSHATLRYASLALLGITVAKVFLVDLSEVQTIWRILSFLVLGLVLLGVSVLYQRRLVK